MRPTVFLLITALAVLGLSACKSTPHKATDDSALNNEVFSSDFALFNTDTHCYAVDKKAFEDKPDYTPLPLTHNDNLWLRVKSGLALEYVDQPAVKQQLAWYKRNPKYLARVQKRANRYLYFIVDHLHQQDVPFDFALLPIVESAYEPFSYSHGQASGLWQFIPLTGGRFKLEQNWWIDERRDTVEASIAAVKYLKYLHRFFDGDWLLAIAAYNAGEGTVRKAVRKNKKRGLPTDFWHLDLPRETSAYVPKMLALSELVRNHDKHGLVFEPIANRPYFDSVSLDAQLDLSQAAQLADTSLEEIYYLNPGLNRWATPPNSKKKRGNTHYALKLPVDKIAQFKTGLNKLPSNERVTWHRHTIKAGDNISQLANQYNTLSSVIIDVNNIRNNHIVIGKTLMIPSAKKGQDAYRFSQTARLEKKQNRNKKGRFKVQHYVQKGDSFWTLSRKYKVNLQALAKWNNKSPKDTLRLGEKLVVWQKNSYASASNGRAAKMNRVNYKIRRGDSLYKVADKFNVDVAQIVRWNNISEKKYLQPGQKLTLYVNVMETF